MSPKSRQQLVDEQKVERRKRQKQHDKTRQVLEKARDAVQEHKLKDLTENLKNHMKAARIHEDMLIEQGRSVTWAGTEISQKWRGDFSSLAIHSCFKERVREGRRNTY